MMVDINLSILAHITADPELQGRLGVQGNVFTNTIGYLHQHLDANKDKWPKLTKLTESVHRLHLNAEEIQNLNSTPTQDRQRFNDYCTKTTKAILALPLNDELMLQGGWRNCDGGHAMIYHFKRDALGVLRLFVYNSGAGLNFHDKTSTVENERYYSTKVYEFPSGTTEEALTALIEEITVVHTPTLRKDSDVNAQNLYQERITSAMSFLIDATETKPTLAHELFSDVLSTTGQVTGTCTQRAIHQMLKYYFMSVDSHSSDNIAVPGEKGNPLREYQRFSLDFKIHALTDYLRKNNYPHSKKVRELIQLAIANTITICDIPDLFDTLDDKAKRLEALDELNQNLNSTILPEKTIASSAPTAHNYHLDFCYLVPLVASVSQGEEVTPHVLRKTFILNRDASLVTELQRLYEETQSLKKDPLWVMEQIERTMLALPTPGNIDESGSLYQVSVETKEQFEEADAALHQLQGLYQSCCESAVGENHLPQHTLIQMNILAMRDQIARLHCSKTDRPSFSPYFKANLDHYFVGFRHSPYVANHDRLMDKRFEELKALASRPKSFDRNFFTHYNQLLDLHPQLKDDLSVLYEHSPHLLKDVDQLLRKSPDSRALFELLKYINEKGEALPGSILSNQKWAPLLKTIQQQLAIENSVLNTMNPLLETNFLVGKKLEILLNADTKSLSFSTPLSSGMCGFRILSNKFIAHQYALTNVVAKKAFEVDTLTSHLSNAHSVVKTTTNAIQLSPHDESGGRTINKDDFLNRDLFHLRTSPRHQINLTLDYFQSEMHRLFDVELQQYLKGNLFEPGLLLDLVSRDSTFMHRFDAFIHDGLRNFMTIDNKLTNTALFFIRLSVDVHRYVGSPAHLADDVSRINGLLSIHQDPALLASLHRYRFLALLTRYRAGEILDDALFHDALDSYFYMQARNNPQMKEDKATEFELKCAVRQFKDWIKAKEELITPTVIQRIAILLNPAFDKLSLNGAYPTWTFTHPTGEASYCLNVESGYLYQENRTYRSIPLALHNSPILKHLGLEEDASCLMSPDEKTLEFVKPDGHVMIILDQYNHYRARKQWTINGRKEWYELRPLNIQQQHALKLSQHYLNSDGLSLVLNDASIEAWQRVSDNTYLLTQQSHPMYIAGSMGIKTVTGKKLISPHQNPDITAFEDTNFILSLFDKDGLLDVNFVRYGLILKKHQDNRFHDVKNPELILKPRAASPFSPAVSCLSFSENADKNCGLIRLTIDPLKMDVNALKAQLPAQAVYVLFNSKVYYITSELKITELDPSNIVQINAIFPSDTNRLSNATIQDLQKITALTGHSHDKNPICMVPIQPFYVDDTQSLEAGDFYQFKHDTTGKVAAARLQNYWNKELELPPEKQPLWNYQHSAGYIKYALENGQPKPDNASDGLYLCYLYLATGELERAWQVLDDVQKRLPLQGTYDEFKQLDLILNALPAVLRLKDEDAKRATPQYLTCKLKVLALFTTFLGHGKTPDLPLATDVKLDDANGHDEQLTRKKVKTLYQTLPEIIYSNFNTYLNTRRHLTHPFYLDEMTQKSLLDYYASQNKNIMGGSFGYQQEKLNLSTLSKEMRLLKENLQHVSANVRPMQFTPLDKVATERRIDTINKEVDAQKAISKTATRCERVAIDLSMPLNAEINIALLSTSARDIYYHWNRSYLLGTAYVTSDEPINKIMDALKANISQDDFIRYFPDYLRIAKDKTSPHAKKLQTFCIKYLIGHRHVALDKQSTNIPLLTNLLYRVLCNAQSPQPKLIPPEQTIRPLISALRETKPTPIEIYQTKDVFSGLLAESRDIFATVLASLPPSISPMPMPASTHPKLPPLLDALCDSNLNAEEHEALNKLSTQYKTSEERYQASLNEALSKLREYPSLEELDAAEASVGSFKYTCLQQQQESAKELKSPELLAKLGRKVAALEIERQSMLKQSFLQAFEKAAQIPSDRREAQRIAVARGSLKAPPLTEQALLNLYFNANLLAYKEMTGLDEAEINVLHAKIHECVQIKLELQHLQRVKKVLTDDLSNPPTDAELHELTNALMSENLPAAQCDSAIMRFQQESNLFVRARQIDALSHLLSTPPDNPYKFKDALEKIIMGGGKSKVLLPLMAKKKATGLNLVVVEVPQALLETNYADLNATSQKLFNQTAHYFEFSRDSDCSSTRLKAIYDQLLYTITRRDYLVTTGESVQSLVLKYLELLHSRPLEGSSKAELDEWREQIRMSSKLVRLFKERADAVIDEVHEGLLLKKKLNYTLGAPVALSPEVILLSIQLYQFVDKLTPEDKTSSLQDRYKTAWPATLDTLPHDLVYHFDSPLKAYVNQLCGEDESKKQALVAYLSEKSPCLFLSQCNNKQIRDAFAFFKEQRHLLARTLEKRYRENYGPSLISNLSELKCAMAIPYVANGKPSERSRFGNPLETINYTIQSMYLEGISKSMLKEIVQQWLVQARYEFMSGVQVASMADTQTAKGVTQRYLTSLNVKFEALSIQNDALMERLYDALRFDKTLIADVLENEVLTQIQQEPSILHSDAYNHADSYRSTQGVSGTITIPQFTTLHQKLQYNAQTSLGNDGFIKKLLREKNTSVYSIPFTTIDTFLSQMFTDVPDAETIRAIMDISATFTGLPNEDVAAALVKYFQEKPKNTIKYVLYFDAKNRVCALPIDIKDTKKLINSSDPAEIKRILKGCEPHERFTYYDQSHTVGTDIKQGSNAKGLALVDPQRTEINQFSQGSFRMRGLEAGQSLAVITPQPIEFNALLTRLDENEKKRLKEDNFVAALAKMDNLVRDDLLTRMTALDDPDAQAKLANLFEEVFLEKQKLDLEQEYGAISIEDDTYHVLKTYAEKTLHHWGKILKDADITPEPEVSERLSSTTESIIQKALPQCHPRVTWRKQGQIGREVENEKEKQKEVQVEKEHEQMKESFDPTLEACIASAWDKKDLLNLSKARVVDSKSITSLNDETLVRGLFSEKLLATANYTRVYKKQPAMLGYYLKPVHIILFRKNANGSLSAYLITNEEAEQMSKLGLPQNMWLTNTRHTLLDGTRPPNIMENADYHTLMEQVRFFAGDLRMLAEQNTPMNWLSVEPEKKLAFFREHLWAYRKTSASDFSLIKSVFSNAFLGYEEISQHAFEDYSDYSDYSWKQKYPNLTTQALKSLTRLADVFATINQSDELITENAEQLYEKSVPVAAHTYLSQHLDTHRLLQMLTWMNGLSEKEYRAETSAHYALKRILGINFADLVKKHETDTALIQFDILRACFNSPVFNVPLSHLSCVINNPLVKKLDSVTPPQTSEDLMLSMLASPTLNVRQLKYLITCPQTIETLRAIFSTALMNEAEIANNLSSLVKDNFDDADVSVIVEAIDNNVAIVDDVKKTTMMLAVLSTFKVKNGFILQSLIKRELQKEPLSADVCKILFSVDVICQDELYPWVLDEVIRHEETLLPFFLKNPKMDEPKYLKQLIKKVSPERLPGIFDEKSAVLKAPMLSLLVEKSDNTVFLEKILDHAACDDKVIISLLNKRDNWPAAQLKKMVTRAVNDEALECILSQKFCDDETRLAVIETKSSAIVQKAISALSNDVRLEALLESLNQNPTLDSLVELSAPLSNIVSQTNLTSTEIDALKKIIFRINLIDDVLFNAIIENPELCQDASVLTHCLEQCMTGGRCDVDVLWSKLKDNSSLNEEEQLACMLRAMQKNAAQTFTHSESFKTKLLSKTWDLDSAAMLLKIPALCNDDVLTSLIQSIPENDEEKWVALFKDVNLSSALRSKLLEKVKLKSSSDTDESEDTDARSTPNPVKRTPEFFTSAAPKPSSAKTSIPVASSAATTKPNYSFLMQCCSIAAGIAGLMLLLAGLALILGMAIGYAPVFLHLLHVFTLPEAYGLGAGVVVAGAGVLTGGIFSARGSKVSTPPADKSPSPKTH